MRQRGWMLILALAACLAAPVHAEDEVPMRREPTPEQEKLLDELLARDKERNFAVPAVRLHDEMFEPDSPYKAIFGDLAKGSPGDVENTARTFLKTYGKVLGWSIPDPLAGMKISRDLKFDGARALVYAPFKDGAEFMSGQVVFGFDAAGNLVAVIGHKKNFEPVFDDGTTPAQVLEAAKKTIQDQMPDEADQAIKITGKGEIAEYFSTPWSEDGNVYKMFMVDITVGKPPHPMRVPVIAKNGGQGMPAEDGRLMAGLGEADGEVLAKDPNKTPKVSEVDFRDVEGPGDFLDSWVLKGKFVKVHHGVTERATDFWGNFEEDPYDPKPVNPQFCEVNAYYHLTEARAKALAWGAAEIEKAKPLVYHPFYNAPCLRFVDMSQLPFVKIKEGKEKEYKECVEEGRNNAWFSYADEGLYFSGENPGLKNRSPAYEANAICHEYGHWLEKRLNRHWMLGGHRGAYAEAKAVSEGFGDFFAASVTDDPHIASYTLGNIKTDVLHEDDQSRDIKTDMKYDRVIPVCLDRKECAKMGVDRLHKIHEAGMVFAGACWKLRTPLGKDNAIKTVIAGIRVAPVPVTFAHASLGVIAADQMLTGKNGAEITKQFLFHKTIPELRKAKP